MADGKPLWPGVTYLVVSVRAGGRSRASSFGWDPAARDFTRRLVELPAGLTAAARNDALPPAAS